MNDKGNQFPKFGTCHKVSSFGPDFRLGSDEIIICDEVL